MTLRRRLIDWSLAGLLIVIPALVLRSSLRRDSHLSGFDKAVLRITAPLSTATSWIVEGAGSMWGRYVALVDVERENGELRDDNGRLRTELAAMTRRAYDVAAMEDLVQMKQKTPADTLGARVIAAPLTPFFRVQRIRIDRGDREVEPRMPVISTAGLVGRVDKVYGDYADIMLLSDPGSSVDVVLPRTGARGVLTGLGKSDAYTCKLQWVERPTTPEPSAAVEVGDTVMTSGLGAAFPAGIGVGYVTAVDPHTSGMFQEVSIEPMVDLSRLRAVMVLLAPPPPPDPEVKVRRRGEPAFGERPY